MSAIRLGISGAAGRMGQAILNLAMKDRALRVDLLLEAKGHEAIGKPTSPVNIEVSSVKAFEKADVVIDFSAPKATLEHVEFAVKSGSNLVIGTTGFEKEAIAKIKAASKKIGIVMAPNMSLAANVLFAVAHQVAKTLPDDYDIEIVEAHHRHKKDAPSGTARRLAEDIANGRGWDLDSVAVYGRQGITGERPVKQIGMHVIRAGEIVGEHTAIFAGPGEKLSLRHDALSRDAFAKGSLVAAKFIAKKKNGFFDMQDVLGLK